MKNFKQNPAVLILSFLLFISLSTFGSKKSDSLYVIEIEGKVLMPVDEDSKTYKIELRCQNAFVESVMVIDNEPFILKVGKDSWYTISIIKEGYYQTSICVDTKLPINHSKSYTFHLDVELIPITKNISNGSVIVPVTDISFNNKTKVFTVLTLNK